MRPITINVGEPVYHEFREYARQQGRTMSDLIREAMALYREERMRRRGSVRDLQPLSLGGVIRPLRKKDDLLAEMLMGAGALRTGHRGTVGGRGESERAPLPRLRVAASSRPRHGRE